MDINYQHQLLTQRMVDKYLSNGPDRKKNNNGYEHVGIQKGATFTFVRTNYFWLA